MTRPSGAVRIFLYNWPIYAATWLGAGLLLVVLRGRPFSILLGTVALAWSAVSLLVSFYVYDRSALSSSRWIAPLLSGRARDWATVHAGLDAELDLDGIFPGRCVARLDVFDPASMPSGAIRRARRRTPAAHEAIACAPTSLALPDQACDALVVAFTAHELRDPRLRERFMDEAHRALRPGGRLLLVEHLRDVANLLAFGPGFLHFLPRREWLRLAAHAGFAVAGEARITPWVMALSLERPA